MSHQFPEGWFGRIRTAMPAVATGLGAASYLVALSQYYSWWVVSLVVPFAIAASAIVTTLLVVSAGSWLLRAILLCLGAGGIAVAIVEGGRTGTLLMGMALVLVALSHMPREPQGSPDNPPPPPSPPLIEPHDCR